MDPRRSVRVAEALREELSEIINYEMADPRIATVSVTEVILTPDLRHAWVRVALEGGVSEQQETMQALEGARYYLRRALSQRLDMFRVPELRFEPDLPPEVRAKAATLLRRVRRGRPKDSPAKEDTLK